MKTTIINDINYTVRLTKLGKENAGYAYVPTFESRDIAEQIATMIDAGIVTNDQCVSWITSGCAVDTQSKVRNGISAKWTPKMLDQYWSRVSDQPDMSKALAKAKQLWSNERANNEIQLIHIAPNGNVRLDDQIGKSEIVVDDTEGGDQ